MAMDMVGTWNVGRPDRALAQTSASNPAPSVSAKIKGKDRAITDDTELDGEGGATGHLGLSNNPMAERG